MEREKEQQQLPPLAAAAAEGDAAPPRRLVLLRRRLVLAPRLPVECASLYNRVPRLPMSLAAAGEWTRGKEEQDSREALALPAAAAPSLAPPPLPAPQCRRRRRAVPWPRDSPKVLPHASLANSWSCALCLGRAARPERCRPRSSDGGSDGRREEGEREPGPEAEEEALRRWRDRPLPAWTPLGRTRDARRRGTARPVSFSSLAAPPRPPLLPLLLPRWRTSCRSRRGRGCC